MSYSFVIVAASKAEAKQKIAEEMAIVVGNQPPHSLDQAQAIAAGGAFVDLLGDLAEGHEYHVGMHGSVGYHHFAGAPPVPESLLSAGVGISASIRKVVPNG